jgi:hypothetical protein
MLYIYEHCHHWYLIITRYLPPCPVTDRPVTIVSGPEIMDKFVGSSEKNLRAVFDNPPEVYDFVKNMPNGEAIASAVRYYCCCSF